MNTYEMQMRKKNKKNLEFLYLEYFNGIFHHWTRQPHAFFLNIYTTKVKLGDACGLTFRETDKLLVKTTLIFVPF